jgi:hypothetical protein
MASEFSKIKIQSIKGGDPKLIRLDLNQIRQYNFVIEFTNHNTVEIKLKCLTIPFMTTNPNAKLTIERLCCFVHRSNVPIPLDDNDQEVRKESAKSITVPLDEKLVTLLTNETVSFKITILSDTKDSIRFWGEQDVNNLNKVFAWAEAEIPNFSSTDLRIASQLQNVEQNTKKTSVEIPKLHDTLLDLKNDKENWIQLERVIQDVKKDLLQTNGDQHDVQTDLRTLTKNLLKEQEEQNVILRDKLGQMISAFDLLNQQTKNLQAMFILLILLIFVMCCISFMVYKK